MFYRGKRQGRDMQKGRVGGMTSPSRVYPVRIKWSNAATASPCSSLWFVAMSLLSFLFCCLRPRSLTPSVPYFLPFSYNISNLFSQDEPDENSRLIPASDDVPCVTCLFSSFFSDMDILAVKSPAARHVIVDQQRMKERLGVIVRAKEG
jgi:hypothetical protein